MPFPPWWLKQFTLPPAVVSFSPHPHQPFFLSDDSLLTSRYSSVWSSFACPWWLATLSPFSHTGSPCLCHLWENLYSDSLPLLFATELHEPSYTWVLSPYVQTLCRYYLLLSCTSPPMLGYYPYQAHGSLCHRYSLLSCTSPPTLGFYPLIRHMVCRYFLPFSRLPFHFREGLFCCGDAF